MEEAVDTRETVLLLLRQMVDTFNVAVGRNPDHEKAALDVAVGECRNRLSDALLEFSKLTSEPLGVTRPLARRLAVEVLAFEVVVRGPGQESPMACRIVVDCPWGRFHYRALIVKRFSVRREHRFSVCRQAVILSRSGNSPLSIKGCAKWRIIDRDFWIPAFAGMTGEWRLT